MELVIRSKVQYSSQMAIERQADQQIFQMIGSAQVASAATSCGCCSYSDADASEPGLFFFRERPWVVANGWLCWDHCSNGYNPVLGYPQSAQLADLQSPLFTWACSLGIPQFLQFVLVMSQWHEFSNGILLNLQLSQHFKFHGEGAK